MADVKRIIIPSNVKSPKCTRYTRVVGYSRPIDQWNIGKQTEWKQRAVISHDPQLGQSQNGGYKIDG